MITEDHVREIFKGLEHGDGAGFFEHVDDKVDWIVEGTHPLAGHYKSKPDFLAGTFAKLGKVLPNGAQLVVEHLIVKDDQAALELHSLGDGEERIEVRQQILLGSPLRRRRHRQSEGISRLGDGRTSLRGKPDLAKAFGPRSF
jgi:ketosteroid isomerase-like protein